jgi:4-alpha-glucanotransferase
MRATGEAAFSHRGSGVLLHVTSLPGGRLGRDAYEFVDWLEEAGQNVVAGPAAEPARPVLDRRTRRRRRSPAGAGCSPEPDARVSPAEIESFRRRQSYWADDWEDYAGPDALADQVRLRS